MNLFSTKNINLISLIFTLLFFLLINFLFFFINKKSYNLIQENFISEIENNIIVENVFNNDLKMEICDDDWYIEIPAISLKATIEESIDSEVLKKYVGHFKETSLTLGNIGLAAHNRGYENNFFEKVKYLNEGDEIIYKYNEFYMSYIVNKIEIIKNTNWSYLENTKDNRITLITCVEDEPEYRRCVQAVEKQ